MSVPVFAQFGGFGQSRGGGGFDTFFGPWGGRPAERPVDYSHAPPPKKVEGQPAGGSVLVLGLPPFCPDAPDVLSELHSPITQRCPDGQVTFQQPSDSHLPESTEQV